VAGGVEGGGVAGGVEGTAPAGRPSSLRSDLLSPLPHALPPAAILDTPTAAYILRPHVAHSLRARLATRPFLAPAQRAFLAFQALAALADHHAAGVVHGDVNPENVLLTSGGWLLLADAAPHKPGALPADDPTDFSAFFDASGSRRCYVAPERFVDGDALDAGRRADVRAGRAGDVFSAGCVVAELLAPGHRPLFDLASLLAHRAARAGSAPPDLSRVDARLRPLVAAMVAADPAARPTAAAAAAAAAAALPPVFGRRLHSLWREQLELGADGRIEAVLGEWEAMKAGEASGVRGGEEAAPTPSAPAPPSTLTESVVARDFAGSGVDTGAAMERLASSERPAASAAAPPLPLIDPVAATLLTWLLCSLLRGAPSPDARAAGVRGLAEVAGAADDGARVDAALPYALALAADPAARVRCAAVRCVAAVLAATGSLPPGAGALASEVVAPALAPLAADRDECVRVAAAECLDDIAWHGRRLVDGLGSARGASVPPPAPPAAELAALARGVEIALHDLAVGPASTPSTRAALLPCLARLARALGPRAATDAVLPAALTFTNDRDPALRAAFFRHGASLAAAAAPGGADAFVVCAESALADPDARVAAAAASFLGALAFSPHLRTRSLLAVAGRVLPVVLDRGAAAEVRAAGARFAAAAARRLGRASAGALLAPLVEAACGTAPACMTDADAVAACAGPSGGGGAARPVAGGDLPAATDAPAHVVPVGAGAPAGASSLAAALATAGLADPFAGAEPGARPPPSDALARLARRLPAVGSPMDDLLADDFGASFYAPPPPPRPSPAAAAAVGAAAAGALGADPGRGAPWRPRGVAIAHLAEHTKAVTGVAGACGGRFLVSASADGSARVWAAAALERGASLRSAAAYSRQGGRLLCVAPWGEAGAATGSGNGSVHVWTVGTAAGASPARGGRPAPPRVTGLATVATLNLGLGPVLSVAAWGRGLLLAAPARGGVAAWDPRAPRPAWTLDTDPRHGAVTCIAPDPGAGDWVATGTARGRLAVWDARVLLPVAGATLAGAPAIDALAPALAPARRLGVRGDPPRGPLAWAAARGEASLWDLAAASPRAVLRVWGDSAAAAASDPVALAPAPDAPVPGGADPAPADRAGALCLLPTGAGPLFTGGGDGCVRLWDGARPEESYIVAGDPDAAAAAAAAARGGPGFGGAAAPARPGLPAAPGATLPPPRARIYARRLVGGVPVVDEVPCAAPAPPPPDAGGPGEVEPPVAALMHRDAVTALADVCGASGRLLVSASRDGVVKVWR